MRRVKLYFELTRGELNVNGLAREIAELEVRARRSWCALSRSCCLPWRPPTPPPPNLLRLWVGAVRGLSRRGAKPYVAVKVRGVVLSTDS